MAGPGKEKQRCDSPEHDTPLRACPREHEVKYHGAD